MPGGVKEEQSVASVMRSVKGRRTDKAFEQGYHLENNLIASAAEN